MGSKLLMMLQYRIQRKRESNCCVLYGKKGAGKSYLALRMATLLDPNFTLDHVVFSSKQFFEIVDKLKPGSVIIYDEVGVGASNRDSQTRSNKNLSAIFQTVRPRAITVLCTTPSFGLIDPQVRNMMDFAIEVLGHQRGITKFKFKVVVPDPSSATPRMPFLVFNGEDGRPVKYLSWTAKQPEPHLAKRYEKRRDAYLSGIISDANNTEKTGIRYRDGVPSKNKRVPADINKYRDMVLVSPDDYKNENGAYDTALIQSKLNIGQRSAGLVARLLKSKSDSTNTHAPLSLHTSSFIDNHKEDENHD